jgi:hypothetical protein
MIMIYIHAEIYRPNGDISSLSTWTLELKLYCCFTFKNKYELIECILERLLQHKVSRDSAVGIATDYWLEDRGVGVRVPEGQEFSLLHLVETGSGVHPIAYQMGTGGKAAGAWSWRLTSN